MWYNIKVVKRWPVGQAVKTLASHAGNMGSIPVRVTKKRAHTRRCVLFFCDPYHKQSPAVGGGCEFCCAKLAIERSEIGFPYGSHQKVCALFLVTRTLKRPSPKAEVRRCLPFLLAKRRCLAVEANSESSEARHIPVRVTPEGVCSFFGDLCAKRSPAAGGGGRIQIRTPPKAISTDIQYRFY